MKGGTRTQYLRKLKKYQKINKDELKSDHMVDF